MRNRNVIERQGPRFVSYLSKSIWQSWVHSCCSFSVKDSSFNGHNWLNRSGILYSNKENSSIHGAHGIEEILLGASEITHKMSIFIVESHKITGMTTFHEIYALSFLPLGSKIPKDSSKHQGYEGCEQESHCTVWWVSPIWKMLLP